MVAQLKAHLLDSGKAIRSVGLERSLRVLLELFRCCCRFVVFKLFVDDVVA